MSGVHSDTCPTCTCQSGRKYCDAEVPRLHETFACIGPPNHPMPHKGLVPAPCSECSGLYMHAAVCSRLGVVAPGVPWFDLQWDDGDTEPRLVPREQGAQK